MGQHTLKTKRIKSHVMGSLESVLTTETEDVVADSYVFQDDVRLVGVEIGIEFEINDAASNADGEVNGLVELSRSGRRSQDGSIGRVEAHQTWNATVALGGPLRYNKTVMFAEGYGYDFDEGETINLLAFFHYTGGVASVPFYPEAILYWVER